MSAHLGAEGRLQGEGELTGEAKPGWVVQPALLKAQIADTSGYSACERGKLLVLQKKKFSPEFRRFFFWPPAEGNMGRNI